MVAASTTDIFGLSSINVKDAPISSDSYTRGVPSSRHHRIQNTVDAWPKPACEMFRSLYEELKNVIFSSDYVQVD